ncbi:hypothetical protein [Paenibacillus tuaregi]|uniref:hypothetical protein n=1 Tax=Paenibacillus tuaregi TaxID=1816681 RepID=UPI000838D492|nr:hypothetical protein [Paenibacillus tuaregi]
MLRKADRAAKATAAVEQAGLSEMEIQYSIEELSEKSEALFHVKPEVLAGALYGTAREKYSVLESAELVQQFLKAKVK